MSGPPNIDGGSPPTVEVTSQSGRVVVIAEDRADVVVTRGGRATAGVGGRVIVVPRGGSRVEVRCPAGSDLIVGTASGRVELRGRLGDVRVTTASGRIAVEQAQRLDARTASGAIEVSECGGDCRLHAASGRVTVGRAGSVDIVASSGRVSADQVGAARVRAASGRVDLGLTGPGPVDVRCHSGTVTVTVPRGMRPATDLSTGSGRVECDVELGTDGKIAVHTGSGRVVVAYR